MVARWLGVVALVLIANCVSVNAHAQRLGRLFSTPEERLQLDELRREYEYGQPAEPESQAISPTVEAPKGPSYSQFTINGVVVRSDGSGSTWVNGTRVSQGDVTREGVRIKAFDGGRSVSIVLPSGADSIQLKAGQKIDVASGAVLDAYEYREGEGAANAFSSGEGEVLETLEKAGDAAVETAKKAVKGVGDSLKKLLETK